MAQEFSDDDVDGRSALEINVSTMPSRIKAAVRYRSSTLKSLAEETEIPYSTLLAYLADRNSMPATALIRIASCLSVDLNWLAHGRNFTLNTRALRLALEIVERLKLDGQEFSDEVRAVGSMYSIELEAVVMGKLDPLLASSSAPLAPRQRKRPKAPSADQG